MAHTCSRKKKEYRHGGSGAQRDEACSEEEYRTTHAKCATVSKLIAGVWLLTCTYLHITHPQPPSACCIFGLSWAYDGSMCSTFDFVRSKWQKFTAPSITAGSWHWCTT